MLCRSSSSFYEPNRGRSESTRLRSPVLVLTADPPAPPFFSEGPDLRGDTRAREYAANFLCASPALRFFLSFSFPSVAHSRANKRAEGGPSNNVTDRQQVRMRSCRKHKYTSRSKYSEYSKSAFLFLRGRLADRRRRDQSFSGKAMVAILRVSCATSATFNPCVYVCVCVSARARACVCDTSTREITFLC